MTGTWPVVPGYVEVKKGKGRSVRRAADVRAAKTLTGRGRGLAAR